MKKPNIIFILMDDMGWMDLSCYGSRFYETPNIDRLAAESMTFTNAYAAAPVCSPTRASLLSGKYPAIVGVTDWICQGNEHPNIGKLIDAPYIKYLPLTEKSLASSLKDAGYNTWHVGKWHLGQSDYWPDKHGFDVNVAGFEAGHPKNGYFSPYNLQNLENGPDGEYLTDRLTDEAINLIRNNGNAPFFLNFWHYAVHTPIQAKEKDIQKYREKRTKMGLDDVPEFEVGEFMPFERQKDKHVIRRLVQSDPVYAAMIENLDYNVGRLLDEVKKLGVEDNTLVIFTSDNGGESSVGGSPTCNSPLAEGKGWMYEGGIREPLIIKWPGVIEKGSICDTPVTSPDFYPTLLEAAGLPLLPKQHCDGVSFMPLLKGAKLEREAIYWHYPHYGNQGGTPAASVRMGDYKLIKFFEDGRLELYDLAKDIGEDNDLSREKPELTREMNDELSKWLENVSAKIPLQSSRA